MTNTHTFSLLRAATTAFLLFGIALIVSAHGELYLGQLTGQVQSPALDGDAVALVSKQLTIGMVIVMMGIVIHLFWRWKTKKAPVSGMGPRGNMRPAYVMK